MAGKDNRFKTLVVSLTTLFTWISGLTIFAMMFLITIDVVARYIFKSPLKGGMDLGQMMLILIGFLGMAHTQAEKGHVRVEVLTSRLPKNSQRVLEILTSFMGAFIAGLMGIQMARHAIKIMTSPEVSPKTDLLFIPHAPFIFIAALGCLLFGVRLLLDALGGLKEVANRPLVERAK